MWEPCHRYAVLRQECRTSMWSIVHAICRFLQSCNNTWWMTCFWWQLTYDITIHIIRLSLKEGCSEINVKKIQLLLASIWQLIRNPCLVGAGDFGLQVIFLLILETAQYPSSLRPEDVALFVGLDGEYPPSCHKILRF